jgi:hypothetical protein
MIVLDDQHGRPALEELRVRYNRYIQAIFSLSPETSIASLCPKNTAGLAASLPDLGGATMNDEKCVPLTVA